MKTDFYYWMMRLAHKVAMYHYRNFYKWRERFKKYVEKWNEGYITGGGADNADPD